MNVLLVGATGAVGRSCLDVLARNGDACVTIAGRDQTRLRQAAAAVQASGRGTVEIARLDVTDVADVAAAVPGRDVVINCAGPSQQLSAAVAGAAIAAMVPYVDPGGNQALTDQLVAGAPAVPVVLQAGVQPGLSEVVLRMLAPYRTDGIGDVTVWCGGLQHLTAASVHEYLASLRDPYGHPGSALRGGMIERVRPADCRPAPSHYFSDSATVHPHLDAETVALATHLGLSDVLWMNVFDGAHITRAMHSLALDEQPQGADLDAVLAAATLDLFGRRPYFAIVGCLGSTTVAFTCPDSYRVTGALTAFAAEHVAGLPAGVQPLWSIDEPKRMSDFLTDVVPGAEITYADDSVLPMIEEGLL